MSLDYVKYETFNGGSKHFESNDIRMDNSLFSYIYTLIFGGNVEASTTGYERDRGQREDYWGNGLFPNSPSKWINSEFERTLRLLPLNSSGRLLLEQALLRDLKPLSGLGTIEANVAIIGEDKISINILIDSISVFSIKLDDISAITDPKQPEIKTTYEFSPDEEPFNFSGENEEYIFSEGIIQ